MFFLKKYKPRSPGTRNRVVSIQFDLFKKQKFCFFFKTKTQSAGRNKLGKITVRHHGATKQRMRTAKVDRIRLTYSMMSVIVGIFKQKRNMCFFGLIRYSNGIYSYIPLASGLKISDVLNEVNFLVKTFDVSLGVLCFFLEPHITYIFFNICSVLKKKALYARAAGTYCSLLLKNIEKNVLKIILPSEQFKFLSMNYCATIGRASNLYSYKFRVGKSGINRNYGIRPTVRGVAMNAVDHPNGGRTKTNKPEKNPWGKIAKHNK